MSSIIKFKSNGTTYIDSSNADKNFSFSKKILSGNLHGTSCDSSMYKSIITFDISRLQAYPIESASLCIFVDNINSSSSYYSNNTLSIYRNTNSFDINSVTWNSSPSSDSQIYLDINPNDTFKYIKIDLNKYIDYWINNGNNYGITLEANNFYSSLIAFNSFNSQNPPLLFIEYKSI